MGKERVKEIVFRIRDGWEEALRQAPGGNAGQAPGGNAGGYEMVRMVCSKREGFFT